MNTLIPYKYEFGTQNKSIKIILLLFLILFLINPLKNNYSNSHNLSKDQEPLSILATREDLIPKFITKKSVKASNLSRLKVETYSTFPATLTGKYSAIGVDTDLNLLFNKIRINIEVNSTANFSVAANFKLRWNFGQTISFPLTVNHLYIGIQNLTYECNPREYYNSINKSSCSFEYLSLQYAYGLPVGVKGSLVLESFFNSRKFNSTEFDKPEAFITGRNSIIEVDSDGDGLINSFNASTEVDISKSGIYTIFLNFVQNTSKYSIWKSVTRVFDEGTFTLEFTCFLGDLYTHKINSTYLIKNIEVSDQFNRVHFTTDSNSTRCYSYSEFDPPGVFLTKNYSDQGRDTDADGLFNYLSITIELNVTVEGMYKISGLLSSNEANYYQEWRSIDLRLYSGIRQVSIEFNIRQNYSHSWNDSYILDEFCIQDSTNQTIVNESKLYITKMYQSTSFDPPVIILLGNFWDQGIDSDEDQVYNLLEIVVEVNITENIFEYISLLTLRDARSVEISSQTIFSLNIGFHKFPI